MPFLTYHKIYYMPFILKFFFIFCDINNYMERTVLVVIEFVPSLLFSVCIVSCLSPCTSIYSMQCISLSISTLHLSAPFIQQESIGTWKAKLPLLFICCNAVSWKAGSGFLYDVQASICNNLHLFQFQNAHELYEGLTAIPSTPSSWKKFYANDCSLEN